MSKWTLTMSGMPKIHPPPNNFGVARISPLEKLSVMTTYFIRQQLDIEIHDIIYHVSRHPINIARPLVHNEVKQTRE